MIKEGMLYLYIDKNQIKLLVAKKSLLGQYSIATSGKKYQVELLKNGTIPSMDILASAVREVIQQTNSVKDKDVMLILPQEAFRFLRVQVPSDITASAVDSFITDKIKSTFGQKPENLFYDYFVIENEQQKILSLYVIPESTAQRYQEMLKLLDLKLNTLVPASLPFFKLFEKTLRKGKIENILYAQYETDSIVTYTYDSFGLLDEARSESKVTAQKTVEHILKTKGTEAEKKDKKFNRLILSGTASDTVRQDTFTKDIGIWTNPLKRIIPQFYQDYIKLLITPKAQPFSLLEFDGCFGAFIFSLENKTFSPLKRKYSANVFSPSVSIEPARAMFSKPSIPAIFTKKEVLLFVGSFVLSFLIFSLISNFRIPTIPSTTTPTKQADNVTVVPPSPTPSPTPAFTREDLKVEVLNGSGIKGKAIEVKDILQEKKYQEIVTGNADNFEYKQTEVRIKKSKKEAVEYVTEDLKDYTTKLKITDLDETETADIVVVIGVDFK